MSSSSHLEAFKESGSPVTPSRSGATVTKGKNGKEVVVMEAPESVVSKVLNASWDSGSAKSKKNNKVRCFLYSPSLLSSSFMLTFCGRSRSTPSK